MEIQDVVDRQAANLNHQRKINREILEDLMSHRVTEEDAKTILTGIIKKEIRNLTVNY